MHPTEVELAGAGGLAVRMPTRCVVCGNGEIAATDRVEVETTAVAEWLPPRPGEKARWNSIGLSVPVDVPFCANHAPPSGARGLLWRGTHRHSGAVKAHTAGLKVEFLALWVPWRNHSENNADQRYAKRFLFGRQPHALVRFAFDEPAVVEEFAHANREARDCYEELFWRDFAWQWALTERVKHLDADARARHDEVMRELPGLARSWSERPGCFVEPRFVTYPPERHIVFKVERARKSAWVARVEQHREFRGVEWRILFSLTPEETAWLGASELKRRYEQAFGSDADFGKHGAGEPDEKWHGTVTKVIEPGDFEAARDILGWLNEGLSAMTASAR